MVMAWAVVAAVASIGTGGEEPRGRRPDLNGRWSLNAEESEDPRAKFTWSDRSEPAGGPLEVQGRPAGRGRPKAGPPEAEEMWARIEGSVPPAFREFLDPPSAIAITAGPATVTIDDGRGAAFRLVPDGSAQREGSVARVTRWEGPSLVVDSRIPDGTRLMTRYDLMPGGRRIEVFSMLTDPRRHTVTLRRVYDAAESSE